MLFQEMHVCSWPHSPGLRVQCDEGVSVELWSAHLCHMKENRLLQ